MRAKNLGPLLVGLICALVALPALAQEAPRDDVTDELATIGLEASPELQRQKRREARKNGKAFTFVGTAATGYDSNIYKGISGATSDSALFDVGAKVEGLFYATRRDRFKVSLESTTTPYTATQKVSSYTQELDFFYAHRSRDWGTTSFSGEIRHKNDSATNAAGEEFTRNYESMVYRARAGQRLEVAEGHIVKLSYAFKRKDYFETPGLVSLDWWRHGPKVQYWMNLGEDARWDFSYEFQEQLYDVEPSSNRDGAELPGNPPEVNFFQTVRTGIEWQFINDVIFEAGFRFRSKDDRFEGYESYSDYQGELSLTWVPTPVLNLEVGLKISHRDYDGYPENISDNSGQLKFDRYRASALARYQFSERLAAYAAYAFDKRDSNRTCNSPISPNQCVVFRSYAQHTLAAGVTAAF